MNDISRNRLALLSTVLVLTAACREPAPPPAAQTPPPRVSSDAPGGRFDLGEVVRRVHFSYRPEGDGWSAGHSSWSARATASGLTFTPRHALQAPREASSRVLTGTPVTFGAASFSRDGVRLEGATGPGVVREDGTLALSRGEVAEEFHNSESGIEQRWRFARAPQGEGALLIRVPVRGLRFVGETAHGVHFADATGLGVRYGQAAWTDAAGKRTQIPARAVAGAVEFQVPAALLASSAFPTLLAPNISPEFGLDTPVTDPGGGTQAAPAVATDGTDFLAVWTDDRGGELDIYGARVSQAGSVLDSFGIPISTAQNAQQSPAVAFDGTNYLVVWSDGRRGSGTDIYGARVSTAGTVLDASGVALATSPTFNLLMSAPAVTFGGANYLVAWEEKSGFSSPTNLYAIRVSSAGTPVDSVLTLSAANGNQSEVALAFDGTNYVAVWHDERSGTQTDIYATQISPTGTVLNLGGIGVSTTVQPQLNPTVASMGTSTLVVWEDYRNSATTGADLYAARLGPEGNVLDPAGLPLVQEPAAQTRPTLTRQGSGYLLGWQDLRSAASQLDVYVARVSETGAVLDASGVAVSTAANAQSSVALAASDTHALVAWHDARAADIVGARVSAAGAVLDPSGFTVSLSANSQSAPAVAFDGANYLVVWQDNRGNGFDLYGVRVSSSGTVLDASGLALSTASGHQRKPALAFDGTNYLVVWEDTRGGPSSDIYGARVSPSGTVLDPDGLTLCARGNAQENPALAFDGTNYLVVWDDAGTSSSRDIYGTRVSRAGAVLDVLFFPISTQTGDQAAPALAFDGTNYLVAWSDWRNGSSADIFGSRINPSGTVLEAAGIQLATGLEAQTEVALAFDGTNYLIAWTDYRLPPHANLAARRVRTSGSAVDATPITVSAAPGHQYQPSVIFNGTDYLVAWQDGRSGTDLDIYAARVTRSGVALDGDGFVLSANPTDESQVALAAGGPQGMLAVYQAADASQGNTVQRLKARRLSTGSNTAPTADAQSATTGEDQPLVLELTGTDPEGDALTFAIASQPEHGTLSGTSPKFTYTPAANYFGPDSFTFTVSDGQATSAPATVSLDVSPVNDAPVAAAQSISTPEDTPKAFTLDATDADNDTLSFTVTSSPSHGTLTGTPPALTYTPEANYTGPDSFTFTASDSETTSAPATVSITVTQANDPPVASNQSVTVAEDETVSITLTGTDEDGDSLTFALASSPAHGTLTGTPPTLTYTPAGNYTGPDSFTFTASDGQNTSAPATVSLTVTPVNDAPVATAQSASTLEDTAKALTLTATDAENDTLSFTVVSGPSHGTLTGTPPALTYMPAPNYSGPDSFTFTASDGQATSAPATVSLTVTPVNDAPVPTARSITTTEGTAVTITLEAVDPEGDSITFALASSPAHGTLTGTPPTLTYTPQADYIGPDSFTFTASDGQATSAPGTLSITVAPVNDPPVATAQSLSLEEDTPSPITLSAVDPEGVALTFAIASQPTHGTLTGTPPALTYTPAANYHGSDSFTFTASDGQNTSAPATVSLTITSVNDTPVATARTLTGQEDTPLQVTLAGVDADGDTLTFAIASQPAHGTLTGTPPTLTYTPEANYTGPDSFTFTASDGQLTSEAATVSLTVSNTNDVPVALAQELTIPAGSPSPIYLDGNDVDGDELTFSITSHPESGRIGGNLPDAVYTPPANFKGTTHFTFSVGDGRTFSSANVQLTVVERSLTVSAAADVIRPVEAQQVQFYANAVDKGGAPITLEWNFGDGTTSQEELPVHAFATPGTYDVRLKATTATEEATTLLRIRVRSSAALVLAQGASQPAAVGEEAATLAFRVDAPDEGHTYTWDWGDGTAATTGATASHAWKDDGRFTVKVTASDSSGVRWVATRALVVHNAPPVPLLQDQVKGSVDGDLTVQLAGSDPADSSDPLQWELVSGEGSLAPDGTFRWTPSEEGLATIITKVLDGDGGERRLAFQISVGPKNGTSPDAPSEGCGCGSAAGDASGALGMGLLMLALVAMARRARA